MKGGVARASLKTSAASAGQRLTVDLCCDTSRAARVPELAVFRIVPAPDVSPAWPLDFWWPALQAFLAPEGAA